MSERPMTGRRDAASAHELWMRQANERPDPVEAAVGALYQEFFKLREAKRYQEEYDAMGALLSMLQADRQHLRVKYAVKP